MKTGSPNPEMRKQIKPSLILVCIVCLLTFSVLGPSTQLFTKLYLMNDRRSSQPFTAQLLAAMGHPPDYAWFPEWSYPTLQKEYRAHLASQMLIPMTNTSDGSSDILFIDGREECERMRGFILSVRQSGHRGLVVIMVYYEGDVANCQGLVNSFPPLEVFYCSAPKYEQTLLQYHGVVNYFQANPRALSLYSKAAVVKPDEVIWCTNPFNDVPLLTEGSEWSHPLYPPATNITVYAVIGFQSDVGNGKNLAHSEFNYLDALSSTCERTLLPSGPGGRVVDHFLAGTPLSLNAYMSTLLGHALDQPASNPYASFAHVEVTKTLREYVQTNARQLEPRKRYEGAQCKYYLTETNASAHCLSCTRGTHSLITGTSRCLRKASGPMPNYTPFCKEPYRHPIMEVPTNLTFEGYATPNIMAAAHRLRTANLFMEAPTDPAATATKQCPDGLMGVVSMMTGYRIHQVGRFIGSFISHADPHCTKMIMFVNPSDGLEGAGELYPDRLEVIRMTNTSEYYPREMQGCHPSDLRYEVILRWLTINYSRFRYIMSIDSRDYLFLADPFAQLIKTLSSGGYENADFVSAVAEAFTAGGSTHPHYLVSFCLKQWVRSCGNKCYDKIARSTFTNGEPLAVLNSGHIIGTAVGLLHYYRFHINMMNESGHRCDFSDQGLFTYYMYGMLQEAHYPHKILVLSSSRSGFANMPLPHRISRREVANSTGHYKTEYTVMDCDDNVIAGLHQFDRYTDFKLIEENAAMSAPWQHLVRDGSFDNFFQTKEPRPVVLTEAPAPKKKRRRKP